jgi:hypothetical protein
VFKITNNSLVIISSFLFIILQILLHFLRPEIDFFSGFISFYGVGKYDFVFNTSLAFLILTELLLAQKVGLFSDIKKNFKYIKYFLYLSSFSTFLVIVFPTDTTEQTWSGFVHGIAAYISFISSGFYLTLLSLNQGFKKVTILRINLLNTFLYIFCLAGFSFISPDFKGLVERLLILFLAIGLGLNAVIVEGGVEEEITNLPADL